MPLCSVALVQKAKAIATSYDFIQHRKAPISKHQSAVRHMRNKVEEEKTERLKAEMAAQNDRNRLRAKEEEYVKMEKAMQKQQNEKEERERNVNDYGQG